MSLNIGKIILSLFIASAHGSLSLTQESAKEHVTLVIANLSPKLVRSEAIQEVLISRLICLVAPTSDVLTLVHSLIGPSIEEAG